MSPTMPTACSQEKIQDFLKIHAHWSLKDHKLLREITFADFKTAFAFMSAVAVRADEVDHHPEWFNVYNRVRIELTTHDAGPAISDRDFNLASFIDEQARLFKGT